MSRKTIDLFHALMKKGWIDRKEDALAWSMYEDDEVKDELLDLKEGMNIDLIPSGDRLYMVPTQDNDLFLKNNIDYRKDIKADNTVRLRDLYLLNYLAIYVLYIFFRGEGASLQTRDFISKEDLIKQFTQHCETASSSTQDKQTDYSENFRSLADDWLAKTEGTPDSAKMNERYGIVNRLMRKFEADNIFMTDTENLIRPTRKTRDLMPYFLQKERINEIQAWMKENTHAADH